MGAGCFDILDHGRKRQEGRLGNDKCLGSGCGAQWQARACELSVLSPEVIYGLGWISINA